MAADRARFSDHPDRPRIDPYRRTYRCRNCFQETPVTFMRDWRQAVADGAPLHEQTCTICGGLMELVGEPLT